MLGWVSLSLVATAFAYDVVDHHRAPGEPVAVGACGQALPPEISRRARSHRLVCGGAMVQMPIRTAIKTPQYEDWSRLERSDGVGLMSTRREMQKIRLGEDPVRYTGSTTLQTYETWVTSVRLRGANPKHCRVWQRPYVHRYTVDEPITERRCREMPARNSAPSIETPPKRRGPDLGPRMDPSRLPRWRSSPTPTPRPVPHDHHENRPKSLTPAPRPKISAPALPTERRKISAGPSRSPARPAVRAPARPSLPSPARPSARSPARSPSRTPSSRSPARQSSPRGGSRGSPAKRSSGGSSSSRSRGSGRRAAVDWLFDQILPRANADQICEMVVVGHRPREVEETRYQTMVDTCEWEEDRVETRPCSVEAVDYTVDLLKPDQYDSRWTPGGPEYHDLLPNKYDLLPGEWEIFTLLVNVGAHDPNLGAGRQSGITAGLDVANAWNTYDYDSPRLACAKNTPIHLNLRVKTQGRIVRRAPNALAEVTDGLGRGRGILTDETYKDGDGRAMRGRPYRLQLTDHSNQAMLTAARQSRKFEGADPEAHITLQPGAPHPPPTRELGFSKSTLLKIKIVEKGGCFGEGEKIFADVLNTSADLIRGEGDSLLVPLDGSSAGVPTFYRPFGFIGRVLGAFGPLDLQLNPGLKYEFRVSMLQQGLPFYKNGCRGGRRTCDQAFANPRMFSEEIAVHFAADPRRDDRAWWQRFEHYYGKKWWNKFRRCGEAP